MICLITKIIIGSTIMTVYQVVIRKPKPGTVTNTVAKEPKPNTLLYGFFRKVCLHKSILMTRQ